MLCAAAIVCVAQSGCGGSTKGHPKASRANDPAAATLPPQTQRLVLEPAAYHQVVARVGRRPITRAYLEQWTPLEVLIASKYKYSASVPSGFVPDPPSYRNCMAYLAALSKTTGAGAGPGPSQLKERCAQEHRTQEQSTLTHLLKDSWSYEEAATKHIRVSQAEIERLVAQRGPKAEVLDALGIPRSYFGFLVGAEILTQKLFATLPAYKLLRGHAGESIQVAEKVDNESTRFYKQMSQRWIARTSCLPEYVVYGCSEYSPEESL